MKAFRLLCKNSILSRRKTLAFPISMEALKRGGSPQPYGTSTCAEEDLELKDFSEFMDSLKNYEKSGVPKDAGTDSDEGFDLGRMRRLMNLLDDPLSKFKVIHVAGTKGKGSTAAFIANILRAEGYSVGCYTSPHIRTIRERISLGKLGEPVSAKVLNSLFLRVKESINSAVELENGRISHFENNKIGIQVVVSTTCFHPDMVELPTQVHRQSEELVLTAVAFKLFAQQNVDIAVIEAGLGGARDATNVICSSGLAASVITTIGEEHLAALGGSLESIAVAKSGIIKHSRPVVFGGPFLPHIERILQEKASSMSSPVVSASHAGSRSKIKGISLLDGRPCQSCDIVINLHSNSEVSFELSAVKLHMLGSHQLHNAITATCTALCLRDLGWRISDGSIKSGLENTRLLGRSQFLTPKEAETLGLSKSMILLDGAHTKDSAKALVDTIQMTFPTARLALVVAMANDKDHLGFAREFLSGGQVAAVFLTEAMIAGGESRTTSSSLLRDCWIQASQELGVSTLHDKMTEYRELLENQFVSSQSLLENRTVLASEDSFLSSMKMADRILKQKKGTEPGIIVVTGSLHAVSLVFSNLHG